MQSATKLKEPYGTQKKVITETTQSGITITAHIFITRRVYVHA